MSEQLFNVQFDTTKLVNALEYYMEHSDRDLWYVCNNKLFDVARKSYKYTFRPDAGTIRDKMNSACKKYPDRTIAEMRVIMKMRAKNIQEFDLKKEAKTVTNQKVGARGYTASGWIESMKILGNEIGLKGFSLGNASKAIGPGGATPVRQGVSVMKGAVWNDVSAKHNADRMETVKNQGAEKAQDEVADDMIKHVEEKLMKQAERFNRA